VPSCRACGSLVLRSGDPCPACGVMGTAPGDARRLLGLTAVTLLLGACQAEYGAAVTTDTDPPVEHSAEVPTADTGAE
jgi:hypothetical protein